MNSFQYLHGDNPVKLTTKACEEMMHGMPLETATLKTISSETQKLPFCIFFIVYNIFYVFFQHIHTET